MLLEWALIFDLIVMLGYRASVVYAPVVGTYVLYLNFRTLPSH